MSEQRSHTRGKQSTAQKRDSSRHGFGPIPATSKVTGASGGNTQKGRTITEATEHYVGDSKSNETEDKTNEEHD